MQCSLPPHVSRWSRGQTPTSPLIECPEDPFLAEQYARVAEFLRDPAADVAALPFPEAKEDRTRLFAMLKDLRVINRVQQGQVKCFKQPPDADQAVVSSADTVKGWTDACVDAVVKVVALSGGAWERATQSSIVSGAVGGHGLAGVPLGTRPGHRMRAAGAAGQGQLAVR